MRVRMIRYSIMLVLVLLITAQALQLFRMLFDTLAGLVGAGIVAAVYLFCGYKARAGAVNKIWFIVPTLLFIVIPAVASLLFSDSAESGFSPGYSFFLLLIDFILPVLILLLVYLRLLKTEAGAGVSDH